MAALGIMHETVLADSKFAPNGSLDETEKLEDSFELNKNNIALKSQSSTDISTDYGSEHQEDYLCQSTLEGRRLSIFQSVSQIEEASVCKGKEDASSEGSSALLKLMNLEEEQDCEISW